MSVSRKVVIDVDSFFWSPGRQRRIESASEWEQALARELQHLVYDEYGKRPSFTRCLDIVMRQAAQIRRVGDTKEVLAARLWESERILLIDSANAMNRQKEDWTVRR